MNLDYTGVFFKEYKKLDRKFNTHTDRAYTYLVNFSQNKDKPIHRWFYFNEGYSPELVENIIKTFEIKKENAHIVDPFCGSGTSLLAAKEQGIRSTGFEINPFSALMAKAKTRNYSKDEIKQVRNFRIATHIGSPGAYEKYNLKIIRNLFDEDKLEKIEIIKKEIGKNRDEKVRELLCAGLLSIVGDLSNYRKGGNGLKRRTVIRDKEPFLEYNKKLEQIAYDLEREKRGPEPDVICDSCLNMEEYAIDDIDLAIFSPPYANCFDPFEIYKIELWIGNFVSTYDELRTKRRRALTSNLNADINKKIDKHHRSKLLTKTIDFLSEQELWDRRIPKMLDIYFYDMNKLMSILHKKIKTGGYCAIIVGNSAYGNLVIPTDLFLAEIGEKNGFETREIIIARKNETSSQQQRKLGKLKEYLRESIVILENG